jgi:hypothetical protein
MLKCRLISVFFVKIDVVHLITHQVTTAVEDLKEAIDTFFTVFESNKNEALNKPQIIWSLHFNINEYNSPAGMLPSNVYSSPGPNSSIDFDDHVIQVIIVFILYFCFPFHCFAV